MCSAVRYHWSREYEMWIHPEDEAPPRNKKLLLYTAYGTAIIGRWGDDCLLWSYLPRVSKELKQRIENAQLRILRKPD